MAEPSAPTWTGEPVATVLITTKDRADELPRAIDSVARQTAPVQLVVVDDGSSDHTSQLVREKYPWAILARNETPLGIIEARNKAASLAETNILFTLDDDAEFSSPDVGANTVASPPICTDRSGLRACWVYRAGADACTSWRAMPRGKRTRVPSTSAPASRNRSIADG